MSDDVVLTHLRTELKGEFHLSLDEGGDTLPGFRGDAGGRHGDPDWVRLSSIIEQLNERFGTEFTKADQLYFDQLEEALAEDDELQAQAQANTLDNFKFGFDKSFEDNIVDRREANEELFNRLVNDQEFSEVARRYLMRRVYERLREEDEAA